MPVPACCATCACLLHGAEKSVCSIALHSACHAQDARKADFPLPKLGPKLSAIQQEASFGRGFALLKGVPVERYSRKESLIAYWLIGQHWGTVRAVRGLASCFVNPLHLTLNPPVEVLLTCARNSFHLIAHVPTLLPHPLLTRQRTAPPYRLNTTGRSPEQEGPPDWPHQGHRP